MLSLIVATPAIASDGTLEINQTCAVQTGCFPGDAAGFSVTISQPGSYRLTSNLQVASSTASAIDVTARGASIELAGFSIAGPGTCTGNGSALVCTGGGSGNGIVGGGTTRVQGGSVRGFGSAGLVLGDGGQVDSVRVEEKAGIGVNISRGSVTNVVSMRNGGVGIQASESVVTGCVVIFNRSSGINAFSSRIADNRASGNGSQGINVQQASVVSDNVVRTSGSQGILATGGVIRNNAVELSSADGIVASGTVIVGNSSFFNGQAGIASLSAASLQGNFVKGNTGVGIYLFPEAGGPAAAYSGNVVVSGPAGSVVNGVNLGGNSCNGNPSCP